MVNIRSILRLDDTGITLVFEAYGPLLSSPFIEPTMSILHTFQEVIIIKANQFATNFDCDNTTATVYTPIRNAI